MRPSKDADKVVPMKLDSASESQSSAREKQTVEDNKGFINVGSFQHVTSVNIKAEREKSGEEAPPIPAEFTGSDEM